MDGHGKSSIRSFRLVLLLFKALFLQIKLKGNHEPQASGFYGL